MTLMYVPKNVESGFYSVLNFLQQLVAAHVFAIYLDDVPMTQGRPMCYKHISLVRNSLPDLLCLLPASIIESHTEELRLVR